MTVVGRTLPRGRYGTLKPITPQQRGEPSHRSTPVVAGNDCRLGAEGVEQPHHVTGQMQQGVLVDIGWTIRVAIAAHIGCHGVEARLAQSLELMAPGIPRFRKAVTHDHQRSRAMLDVMHANTVGLDDAMFHLGHHRLSQTRFTLPSPLPAPVPPDRGRARRSAVSPEPAPQPSVRTCGLTWTGTASRWRSVKRGFSRRSAKPLLLCAG